MNILKATHLDSTWTKYKQKELCFHAALPSPIQSFCKAVFLELIATITAFDASHFKDMEYKEHWSAEVQALVVLVVLGTESWHFGETNSISSLQQRDLVQNFEKMEK